VGLFPNTNKTGPLTFACNAVQWDLKNSVKNSKLKKNLVYLSLL